MSEIIRLAFEEQQQSQNEADALIEELEFENKKLRDLLKIGYLGDPTVEEVRKELKEQENVLEEMEYKKMEMERLQKEHELEQLRHQIAEDMEAILKEEYEMKMD